jgi:hypothetical protein
VTLLDVPRTSRFLCGICRESPRLWKLGRLGVTGLATARSSFDTFVGSRNAGDGESVGVGASERDRVLDGEREAPSAPWYRMRVDGVGVRSRLLCASAWVKVEAALGGGARTPIVDIVPRRSGVEEAAGTRRWHDREIEMESLQGWHVEQCVNVMSCQELRPRSSWPWWVLKPTSANTLTRRLAPAMGGYIRTPAQDRPPVHCKTKLLDDISSPPFPIPVLRPACRNIE